ncbi:MAG: hypothetical protein ACSHW6_02745 [Sulfitobacter geojensis]|uniref:hypothetical protein n=1 Tax=Sulfitobacter geojensis TaxID=1342299 RepID=UPI00046A4C2F|nr:hypothetical protein [Sulfitobacter geojensis]KHA52556.1 hypothetical protein Z947_2864 [Sulfitobacter geojensis]
MKTGFGFGFGGLACAPETGFGAGGAGVFVVSRRAIGLLLSCGRMGERPANTAKLPEKLGPKGAEMWQNFVADFS